MKLALEAQAEGKFLVTSEQDFKSAGFIGKASPAAGSVGYEEEVGSTLKAEQVTHVMQAEILDMTHCDDVVREYKDASPTLRSRDYKGGLNVIERVEILDMSHSNDVIREYPNTCPTLAARMGTGGNQIPLVFGAKDCGVCSQNSNSTADKTNGNKPLDSEYERAETERMIRFFNIYNNWPTDDEDEVKVDESTYCIQGNTIDRSDTAGANGKGVIEGKSYTLNTVDRPAVAYAVGIQPNNSVSADGLSEIEGKSPTLSVTKLAGVCYAVGNGQADQTKLHDVAGALNCMHDQQSVMAAYPINTQIVTRSNKLGEGTGMGIGEDGDPAYTLQAAHSHGVIYAEPVSFENSSFGGYKQGVGTLKASGGDYGGGSENLICQPCSYNSSDGEIAGTLDASYYKGCGVRGGVEREFVSIPNPIGKFYIWIVRRLTPRECERLQGFKDDWTLYDTKGNEIKDTPRYKACGNSIAIPCAMRVFQGIIEVERAS